MENELGLRDILEERGHEYVVTDDKEGEDSEFANYLPSANIVRRIIECTNKPHMQLRGTS